VAPVGVRNQAALHPAGEADRRDKLQRISHPSNELTVWDRYGLCVVSLHTTTNFLNSTIVNGNRSSRAALRHRLPRRTARTAA
jgi:hypothetical protein